MCILLKLDYAKFSVSNLCISKVIEGKPLVGRLDPPLPPSLGTGRVQNLFSLNPRCLNLIR